MTRFFSQNIIAVIWDFDETLIPGYMQAPLFRAYGVEERAFWEEVNSLPDQYRRRGCEKTSAEVLYLNHILDYVRRGRFKDLNNERLRALGAEIEFHPGLPEFFDELKRSLERDPYRTHDIKVEHYVVSTGLRQMILGSGLNPYLDGAWGCELLEEKDRDGRLRLASIGYVLDHTTKTRAVFEINKGSNVEDIDVNARMEESERRVPIKQMIYVADGPSDVPVFSVVRRLGGHTYAVYAPESERAYDQAYNLAHGEERAHAMGPADYRPGGPTWRWLMRTVKDIAGDIVTRRKRQLENSVGKAPGHLGG